MVPPGPQGVLTQAERYARGIADSPYNFDGIRVPFIYSTDGEVTWFHDARHPLNRSGQVADFHTPAAFEEMLGRDFDGAMEQLRATPHTDPKLRPYGPRPGQDRADDQRGSGARSAG